jgi:hypothetical protein
VSCTKIVKTISTHTESTDNGLFAIKIFIQISPEGGKSFYLVDIVYKVHEAPVFWSCAVVCTAFAAGKCILISLPSAVLQPKFLLHKYCKCKGITALEGTVPGLLISWF